MLEREAPDWVSFMEASSAAAKSESPLSICVCIHNMCVLVCVCGDHVLGRWASGGA